MNMVDSYTYIFYFTVIGMLAGIVWSLRYIVQIDKRIENMEDKIETLLLKVDTIVEKEEKEIKKIEESEGVLDETLEERVNNL